VSTPDNKCLRYNKGKAKLSYNLLGPEAQEGEAMVWETGNVKYFRGNWKDGAPWTEAMDSLLRHTMALLNGDDLDVNKNGEADESHSGLPHADHLICCAKIISQSYHTRKDLDDRQGKRESAIIPELEKSFRDGRNDPLHKEVSVTGVSLGK